MSHSGGAGRGSLPPKLYFRIGEVAGLVGVEPHVLRYWEREFRSIRPTKSAKGQRVYSRRDVENLLRVRELLYAEGFTIAGAKKRLLKAGVEPVQAPAQTQAVAQPTLAVQTVAVTQLVPKKSAEPRVRDKLKALRAEIEAFLEDLGG